MNAGEFYILILYGAVSFLIFSIAFIGGLIMGKG